MKPLTPKEEALLAQIEAAFPDPGYPVSLRPCPHLCFECDELGEFFAGRRWHEIAQAEMRPLDSASSLLSDDALRYFLPGLMISCLRDPEAADTAIDSFAWSLLSLDRDTSDPPFFREFSSEQRSAVYTWLDWWIALGDFEDRDSNDFYAPFIHENAEKCRTRLHEIRERYTP